MLLLSLTASCEDILLCYPLINSKLESKSTWLKHKTTNRFLAFERSIYKKKDNKLWRHLVVSQLQDFVEHVHFNFDLQNYCLS